MISKNGLDHLLVRLTSRTIWKRRILFSRLRITDVLSSIWLATRQEYRVGIVGDLEHLKGSKLYKARYLSLFKGKKVVFLPYQENESYHVIVKWEPFKRCVTPSVHTRVVNAKMGNINKFALDQLQKEIFGTSLMIDPTTYLGTYLEKDAGLPDGSGHTANHTPLIIHNDPIEKMKVNTAYVRLLNNTDEEGQCIDFRMYAFNQELYPECYRFVLKDRFETQSAGSLSKKKLVIVEEFSKDEIQKISTFIKRLQLDYGEIDVLRDLPSGEIYVVDVNNTPYGDFRRVGFRKSQIKAMYRSVLKES